MTPQKEPVLTFKVGDLGISRLEQDIDVFNTLMARWMLPPEFLAPDRWGAVGRLVDVYHAGLLFLALLLGRMPTFTEQEILDGRPRLTAESLSSPFGQPVARALRRTVGQRTPSAIEFWRDIFRVARGSASARGAETEGSGRGHS